jgi:hypothetical protein
MKKITVKNVKSCTETGENEDKRLQMFALEGDENMDASDGYHSFDELYDHRFTLFIALCKQLRTKVNADNINGVQMADIGREIWRSKLHSDGSVFDGWFIMGICKQKGHQITYHFPLRRWEETNFAETLDTAPPYDGHTPADVLERLKNL